MPGRAPAFTRRWPPALAFAAAALCACGNTPPGDDGSDSSAAPAEVSASGPDCTTDEILAGLMGGSPWGTGHPAPAAGSVPENFEPVAVTLCTFDVQMVAPSAEPTLLPDVDAVETDTPPAESQTRAPATEESDPEPPVTVRQTLLTGDLDPLLDALDHPSDPAPADLVCMAMMQTQPQILLVDATGAAVRPQWPVDACGFLHEGAAETLTGLEEVESTVRIVEPAR